MNYREYDRIQMELGGVGEGLRADLKDILKNSNADENSKQLVTMACDKITKAFDEVALLVSQAMRASIK